MSSLEAGWRQFDAADWAGARDTFAALLETRPGDPAVLDALGQALWWVGERTAAIERRREAYAAYRRVGDARHAGGVAIYLAGECRIDGQDAEASGWLSRARRLLEGEGPCVELGWLAIEDAKRSGDPQDAERHADAALAIATALENPDIECMGLAQKGRSVVGQGRVEDGLALLDEAMTVALGGETSDPLACGDACCTMLVVCDRLADLQRAAQWCEAVVAFTERRNYTPVQSWCRGIYGGVLLRAGDWERSEAVVLEALRRRPDRRRGGGRALPLAVLAALRVRQGRLEEAEQLLTGLDDEPEALVPLVELHLRRGNLALAQALLDRRTGGGDGALLVLAGSVGLAAGDPDAASAASDELRALGQTLGRGDLVAHGALLAGRVAGVREDAAAAERELDEAVARFAALAFPFEEARARLELAHVQAGSGSPLAVASSARTARDTFDRLGARHDADEAAALLRGLGAAGRTATRGERDELTAREREVLALVAAGLSNAEIADRLVISPKTAEHHVGKVLAKLGVREGL